MNKKWLIVGLMLWGSVAMAAQEVAQVNVSANLAREQCAAKPGAKSPTFQLQVTDARPNPSVGTLKKGDATSDVVLSEKVTQLFEKAIRTALGNCAYQVSTSAPIKVNVIVSEFFAGSTKALLKGETKATGRITVRIENGLEQANMDFGIETADSGMRTGKLKQLQSTLEKVVTDTVVQMVTSQTFVDGLKQQTN